MPHPRFSNEEIVRRGEEIYAARLQQRLDTEENLGKILVIDIETGDYEIDADPLVASHRALAKHPGAAIYALRIGHEEVYGFGGGAERVKQ